MVRSCFSFGKFFDLPYLNDIDFESFKFLELTCLETKFSFQTHGLQVKGTLKEDRLGENVVGHFGHQCNPSKFGGFSGKQFL